MKWNVTRKCMKIHSTLRFLAAWTDVTFLVRILTTKQTMHSGTVGIECRNAQTGTQNSWLAKTLFHILGLKT